MNIDTIPPKGCRPLQNSIWTEEKVRELLACVQERLTARATAERLGCSLGQISSKARRMKLHFDGIPAKRTPPQARPVQVVEVKEGEDDPVVLSNCETLANAVLALRPHSCKWPIGETHSADFHFCGAPRQRGKPYCPQHVVAASDPHAKRFDKIAGEPLARVFG